MCLCLSVCRKEGKPCRNLGSSLVNCGEFCILSLIIVFLGRETLDSIPPSRINQKKHSPYIAVRMVAGDPMDACEWKFGDAVRPGTSVRM